MLLALGLTVPQAIGAAVSSNRAEQGWDFTRLTFVQG